MTALNLSLHRQQTVAFESEANELLYGGAAGGGKALAIDTQIPTPTGWTRMGDIQPGDTVFDETGHTCRVVAVSEIMFGRPCYRVCFSDGAEIVADAGHQWLTMTGSERMSAARMAPEWKAKRRASRPRRGTGARPDLAARNAELARTLVNAEPTKGSIRTTQQIAETLTTRNRTNHSVAMNGAIYGHAATLPIDPYTLGAWLGDGTACQAAITSNDRETIDKIAEAGYEITKRASKYGYGIIGLIKGLRSLDLIKNKHIPQQYLRASVAQRLELLRGLMDTDGHCKVSGGCEFTTTSERLRDGMMELLATLGIKAGLSTGRAMLNGRDCGEKYRIKFTTAEIVFHIQRKSERQKGKVRPTQKTNMIVACDPIESVPVRCIQVDSPSHLFLAGERMIPTHNSHLMRVVSIMMCAEIPGVQIYLFRRHYADLYKNHLEGAGSYPELLAPWIESKHVKFVENQVRFWNGAKIHLCHCQHEKDLLKYQGAEIHVLMVDEATHFTEKQYRFLRGRCRLGGLKVPDKYAGKIPLILAGTNPGGVGHNWVKRTFVDAAPPIVPWRASKKDGGMLRAFIPAKLEDNPTLLLNDPDYEDRLEGLGNDALVRAMRHGDWNIVSGGAFDDVWSPRLILPVFSVPKSWRIDRSFDWGSSKPFSVGWWAEADGTEATLSTGATFCPPRGSLIRIAEWYGSEELGTDIGLKLPAHEIAAGIIRREREMVESGVISATIHPGPADNQINTVVRSDIPTIGQEMAAHGVRWTESDKSPGSRVTGLELLRSRMIAAGRDNPEAAGVYFVETCRAAITLIPTMPRDAKNPDDVDSGAEDHCYDEIRYRILASKRKAMSINMGMAS